MMAKRLILVMMVVGLVAVGGCNFGSSPRQSRSSLESGKLMPLPELTAVQRPPVPDLPVPFGFKLDESDSRSFAEAGNRYVDHIYKGSSDKYTIARFYKRHMPICRWTLVTDMFIRGDITLYFEKEGERCRIVINEGGWFSSASVEAQVWTRGQITLTASK